MRVQTLDVSDELVIDGRVRITLLASGGGEVLLALSAEEGAGDASALVEDCDGYTRADARHSDRRGCHRATADRPSVNHRPRDRT